MARYSFSSNPVRFLTTLTSGLDWNQDKKFQSEAERSAAYQSDGLSDDREFVFAHALRKYQETLDMTKRLDSKREDFLKYTIPAIGGIAAATKLMDATISLWFQVGVTCLLVGAVVLMLSRRVIDFPTQAAIQDVREGAGHVADLRDWMAGSLHETCSALEAIQGVIAGQINFAVSWFVAGGLCFVIELWR